MQCSYSKSLDWYEQRFTDVMVYRVALDACCRIDLTEEMNLDLDSSIWARGKN